MTAITSVAKRFNDPAYFVALFLNPGWQTMAISRKYNVESITKEILKLAKRFGFLKSQCIQIKSDVADYIVLAQARGNWDDIDPRTWWNQQLRCQQLRLFALKILSVRPHTAAVERLFSRLAFTKTKSRSQLGVEKMKMMAVIRTRIRVQEEKRKSARSFPSNKRVLNHPEEDEEREDEAVNEEIMELIEPEGPEGPEPIRVESDDSPDEELEQGGEDKTLVDVFFNIETYCESQPRNTGRLEQAVEGDESDFSINDIL
jgi:hypothetical protein